MKHFRKLCVVLFIALFFIACKNASTPNVSTEGLDGPNNGLDTTPELPNTGDGSGTGENEGGGETTPTVIFNTDLDDNDIAPKSIENATFEGAWAITDGLFQGNSNAKIGFSTEPTTSYTDIANAIKDAINITGVEATIAYLNEPNGDVLTGGHTLVATITPAAGYVFDGESQSKDIYILFDIKPFAHHHADATDSDTTKLQAIIDAAADGSIIAVTGTFNENITITDKSLTFIGYGSGGVIDGQAKGSVMTVNAAEKTVIIGENITLRNGRGTGDRFGGGPGSAINIKAGKVVLDGGTIKSNGTQTSITEGGNIGVITVGSATTFEMNKGLISNNYSYYGGGISVRGGGTFTMNGGTITKNGAGFGGGLHIAPGGTATLAHGTITENIKYNVSGAKGPDVALGNPLGLSEATAAGATLTINNGFIIGSEIEKTANDGTINDNRE